MKERRFALVTGASSGMGLQYVRLLLCRDYDVIAVALDSAETERACRPFAAEFPDRQVFPIGLDLSRPDAVERLDDCLRDRCPGAEIEVLVNNAGLFFPGHFLDQNPEAIVRMLMLHNYAPTALCRRYMPAMLERGRGYVLNVSSLAAYLSYPLIAEYGATKAYLRSLSRALRIETAHSGVSVTAACFGAVDTDLFRLSPRLRRLARRLGVMIPPERAAQKALDRMFRRKAECLPGVLNRVAAWVCPRIPAGWLAAADRFVSRRMEDRAGGSASDR